VRTIKDSIKDLFVFLIYFYTFVLKPLNFSPIKTLNMKKNPIFILILLLFYTTTLISQTTGQCKTVQNSSQSGYNDLNQMCPNLSMNYPNGNTPVEIQVNFIFLQPLTGVGRWDYFYQADCQAMLDFINLKLNNLLTPALALPNPAPFINKTLIKFTFKSITKIPTSGYATAGPSQVGNYSSDQFALNVVYGVHPTINGYGFYMSGTNEVNMIDGDWGPPASQHGGPERMLLAHEMLHALGLWHTNEKGLLGGIQTTPNPNGTILPNVPIDDYWLEDITTYATHLSNNIMADLWQTRDYLSPKQIYYMHYLLRTDPLRTKMVSVWPNYTNYSCAADHTNDWTVSGTQTLGGIFLSPPGDLIISAGSNITLSSCMIMTPGSKIIIEPGAKFNIINGNINTFGCTNLWRGIEVRSAPWASQPSSQSNTSMPPNNVGMLVLNNAKISNAMRAINVGELDINSQYINGTAAGIVFAENVKFVNNQISVQFNSYLNTNDNLSYFKLDTFIVNTNFKLPIPIAGVRIDKTYGVELIGCYFEELDFVSSTAIEVFAGNIIMKDHCTNISGTNCNGTLTQNKIIGFKQGIDIYNTTMTSIPSKIDHVIIDQQVLSGHSTQLRNQVRGGIYIGKNFGSQVTNCTIKTLKKATVNSSTQISYGLYLDNSSGYVVENNVFDGLSAYASVGVCVNNSGYGANSIYNNTITTHDQGIWAQNINYHPTTGTGLLINCNDFINGQSLIGVQSQYGSAAGINQTQGLLSQFYPVLYTRNTYDIFYSSCATGTEAKFYINTQNSFVVTSHTGFVGTQWHPTPQTNNSCSNAFEVIDIVGMQLTNPIKSNYCPISNLPSLSPQALQSDVNAYKAMRNTLTETLAHKLDGGNSQSLLNKVTSNISSLSLRDTLLAKDFLSDTVLKAYFTKINQPYSYLKQVFEKNTPVQPNVWFLISTIGLNEIEYASWDSLQHTNKLSVRSNLESEINHAYTQYGLLTNEKVRRFLNNPSGPLYDSIIAVYRMNDLPDNKFMLADVFIAAKKYDSAYVRITALENESESNFDLCKLLRYSLELNKQENYVNTLKADSSNFHYLKTAANSSLFMKQGYSRSILRSVYNYRVEEVRLIPETTIGSRVINTKIEHDNNSTLEIVELSSGIKIYPNPTNDLIIVEIQTDSKTNFEIQIADLSGKILQKQNCTQNCAIDVSTLKNGVYLLNLYEHDKHISTKKIVVIK
jgi:hypothetical protein